MVVLMVASTGFRKEYAEVGDWVHVKEYDLVVVKVGEMAIYWVYLTDRRLVPLMVPCLELISAVQSD